MNGLFSVVIWSLIVCNHRNAPNSTLYLFNPSVNGCHRRGHIVSLINDIFHLLYS